jgi:hypothetical protein
MTIPVTKGALDFDSTNILAAVGALSLVGQAHRTTPMSRGHFLQKYAFLVIGFFAGITTNQHSRFYFLNINLGIYIILLFYDKYSIFL